MTDAVKPGDFGESGRRKWPRKRLPSSMPNESQAREEYVSDALDLMFKAGWVKQHGRSVKGLGVDWTDRGKLAMEALGYMIEDLGPENLNQQLWWAVGTLANMKFTSPSRPSVFDLASPNSDQSLAQLEVILQFLNVSARFIGMRLRS